MCKHAAPHVCAPQGFIQSLLTQRSSLSTTLFLGGGNHGDSLTTAVSLFLWYSNVPAQHKDTQIPYTLKEKYFATETFRGT